MNTDKEKWIKASKKVQQIEAKDFDKIHPELYTSAEMQIINDCILFLKNNLDSYETAKVLDIACGTGRLSLQFLNHGFNVTGIDLSSEMLSVFKSKTSALNNKRLSLYCQDLETFIESNKESYDCIVLGAFLHHLPDIEKMLGTVIKLIKPDGFLFVVHEPAIRDAKHMWLRFILEKLDSILFQIKYLIKDFKFIPRIKEYGLADIHTKDGINEKGLLDWLKTKNFECLHSERYYSHKTAVVNFIDKYIFKLLPQFYFLVQKKES